MDSLKALYKVGHGPSSSHTMGPQKAALTMKNRYPNADSYKVILYGSLAATGIGHLTDYIIIETFKPKHTEIIFRDDIYLEEHPNGMDLFALDKDGNDIGKLRIFSVGGGIIEIEGESKLSEDSVYPHRNFTEIRDYCLEHNLRLWEYVVKYEGVEILDFLKDVYRAMYNSIEEGLNSDGILPGDLGVFRKAKLLYDKKIANEIDSVTEHRLVSAYAFACSETNASGGLVVTAPTCGASGVLPSVLRYLHEKHHFNEDQIAHALATAGIIGNVIKHNASISGAECGCQAEVGSACSMAAAANCELFNMSLEQIEYAAEIAMEHNLGLTCDPIKGYVQIPCIERNAVGALRAIDSCSLALLLSGTSKISFDTVVKTMYQTGIDLNRKYRETSEGGLAIFHK